MGLADPDILKRPSRPSQFGSESQVRQYIAELKEYIRQIPSARYTFSKIFTLLEKCLINEFCVSTDTEKDLHRQPLHPTYYIFLDTIKTTIV